ncbi:MAG: UDP-glucose 4-epimerase GalE [Weeksellaceae bacterium]|nr:UDP-glucose 4-epimerase GalE [Weeksellaceae bacterium]
MNFSATKTILVTGGLGYIGSHTVVMLLEQGFSVVIVDNLSNSQAFIEERIREVADGTLQVYIEDVTNEKALEAIFQKHDIAGVLHFAAHKAVGESMQKPLEYYHNNISGLISLLACMKKYEVDNIIFSSSCTVYGEAEQLPINEQAPFQEAASVYGRTKQIAEHILHDFANACSKKIVSLRYFNPVGAHPSARLGELPGGIPDNLVPYITQTAAGVREYLFVFGNDYPTRDGTAIRDYIYIMDLADAHVLALQRLLSLNFEDFQSPEIYNLGTGRGYTVLEVISAFEKASGTELPYKFAPKREGDVTAAYADNKKAKEELGWQANTSLEYALSTAWKWEQAYRSEQSGS